LRGSKRRGLTAVDVVAIVVGALAVVAFVIQVALPASTRLTNGFSAYDTAARLVLEGADPSRFYDDDWFRSQTIRFGFATAQDIYNVNPPAAALLLVPLAGLPPVAAKQAWTVLNLGFVGVALILLARICHWSPAATGMAVIAVTLFEPVREQTRLGQAYALLLVLEAALAWAYLERHDGWVGGILGVMLGFKAAALAVPALLIAQRRWRAVVSMAIALLAVVGLTIPFWGWAAWSTYVRLLFDIGSHPEIAVTAYQSVPSLFLHLFRLDPTWNPTPIADVPGIAVVLVVVAELTLVAITFIATARATSSSRSDRSLGFAAWTILTIVASPASADYHYTLLIVPIALLLATRSEVDRRWPFLAALGLGVLLIGAPIPYKSPLLTAGAWALLAYPKMYGGLLLWALAVFARRPGHASRTAFAGSSPHTA
jgi:hypothetical protein